MEKKEVVIRYVATKLLVIRALVTKVTHCRLMKEPVKVIPLVSIDCVPSANSYFHM
jgi:hypothetical protein